MRLIVDIFEFNKIIQAELYVLFTVNLRVDDTRIFSKYNDISVFNINTLLNVNVPFIKSDNNNMRK